MRATIDSAFNQNGPTPSGRMLWLALIVTSGIGLTTLFACATPFAALATLAALKLGRRDMIAVVGMVWLANQAIGYGFLGYPGTWDSAAWGLAIGLSSGLAVVAARGLATTRQAPLAVSLPFMGAFVAFELGLYLAGRVLPGSDEAFSASVILHVFVINGVVLYALIIVYRLAMAIGRLSATGASTALPAALTSSR